MTARARKSISVYFHVPFCKSKCNYCSFASGVYPPDKISLYFELVQKDFSSFFSLLTEPYEVPTLYIGGGTPSSVPMEFLVNAVEYLYSLIPKKPYEITIEANPGDVNPEFIKAIGQIGVNRISLGAQSFNDNVLEFLGRRHTVAQTVESYNLLRECGFSNINLDLIHGVPDFSFQRWRDDLSEAISLDPDHISLYALSVEEGTPFYEHRVGDRLDHDADALEYDLAVKTLRDTGYHRYEISNFSLPGKECRHNINYWRMGEYVGFGPSAASHGNDTYVENVSDPDTYMNLIEKGLPAVENMEKFTGRDRWVNALIMGMRLDEGIEIDTFNRRYDVNLVDEVTKVWKTYLKENYVILDKNILRFGDKAVYVSNSLLSMLM